MKKTNEKETTKKIVKDKKNTANKKMKKVIVDEKGNEKKKTTIGEFVFRTIILVAMFLILLMTYIFYLSKVCNDNKVIKETNTVIMTQIENK